MPSSRSQWHPTWARTTMSCESGATSTRSSVPSPSTTTRLSSTFCSPIKTLPPTRSPPSPSDPPAKSTTTTPTASDTATSAQSSRRITARRRAPSSAQPATKSTPSFTQEKPCFKLRELPKTTALQPRKT